jgi:hypothetical protein
VSKDLTREVLDRLALYGGGRVGLACDQHPDSGTSAIYQDGALRILCRLCGFEAARVKVAAAPLPSKSSALKPFEAEEGSGG